MKQYLEDAVKDDPELYDAYLGQGLYNFALSDTLIAKTSNYGKLA